MEKSFSGCLRGPVQIEKIKRSKIAVFGATQMVTIDQPVASSLRRNATARPNSLEYGARFSIVPG